MVFPFCNTDDTHDHFSLSGELNGIADQIDQNLAESSGVAFYKGGDAVGDIGNEFQMFLMRGGRKQFEHVVHQYAQVEVGVLQLQLARFDLRKVENVVDDIQERVARSHDRICQTLLLGVQGGLPQECRQSEDAVHGGPNLVAHVREEVRFRDTRGLRGLLGGDQFLFDNFEGGNVRGDS